MTGTTKHNCCAISHHNSIIYQKYNAARRAVQPAYSLNQFQYEQIH